MASINKAFLKNMIRDVDSHNRREEISECWRQHTLMKKVADRSIAVRPNSHCGDGRRGLDRGDSYQSSRKRRYDDMDNGDVHSRHIRYKEQKEEEDNESCSSKKAIEEERKFWALKKLQKLATKEKNEEGSNAIVACSSSVSEGRGSDKTKHKKEKEKKNKKKEKKKSKKSKKDKKSDEE